MGFGILVKPDLDWSLTPQFDPRTDFASQLTGWTLLQTIEFAKQGLQDGAICRPNLLKVLHRIADTRR
jgi:hypothetical protein